MRLRFASASLFAVFCAVVVGAQDPPPRPAPQEQRPTFRTEANFVRVDVYPTAGGRAVTDLRAEEFEVFEDGDPQKVEAFEHVVIRPMGPQTSRVEPNTIGEARDMARNPRARVIILFLDAPHVTMEGAWLTREPIIRLLDQILGPDDLVGVMTPRMAPTDIVLARKTDVIASGLRNAWPWGERFTLHKEDIDTEYERCYPPTRDDMEAGRTVSALAREMQLRRQERATLDALEDLVQYLRDLRDERKAIVTLSEGWLLFRPNQAMFDLRRDKKTGQQDPIPGVDPITVGPDGRITTRDRNRVGYEYGRMQCDSDRMKLAMMDNDFYFREIMDDANRANASFYTVDPRGLPVFDNPIGPDAPPPPLVDAAMLRSRQETLRTLALNTDGLAVLNSNDLNAGMKRIAEDLTSYYLLGYYSTHAKPDGKFHSIKVRVKRPGVEVRARRGYRAATAEEVARARTAAAPPVPESVSAVTTAIASLGRIRPDARVYINAVAYTAATAPVVWVAGELAREGTADPWSAGATADVEVGRGGANETMRVTIAPGQRTFLAKIPLAGALAAGPIDVRVRIAATGAPTDRTTDAVTTDLGSGLSRPLMFRRGPYTGNRLQPAASFLFSRTERPRFEIPIDAASTPGTGRLLDKTGQPLAIPVTVGERTDAEGGQRWMTADLTLAPLAAGDYAIELTAKTASGEQRAVTAIRVVR